MFVRHLEVAATNAMDRKWIYQSVSEKGIDADWWAHALWEREHMVIAPSSTYSTKIIIRSGTETMAHRRPLLLYYVWQIGICIPRILNPEWKEIAKQDSHPTLSRLVTV